MAWVDPARRIIGCHEEFTWFDFDGFLRFRSGG
jgi:hypothetical protein